MRSPTALVFALALVLGLSAGCSPIAAAPIPVRAAVALPASPALGARLTLCRTGPTAAERVAQFTGTMPARPDGWRMAMRFSLQVRARGERRFRTVPAPGFGRWVRSKPERAGFVYAKQVDGLSAPARYRSVIELAWLDRRGRTVARARRVTPVCVQPDQRPDLRLLALRALGGSEPGVLTYLLTVVNAGRGDAGAFVVTVGPDGAAARATAEVGPLAPGQARLIVVDGPACSPPGQVRAVLDAGAAVAEASESDNDVRRACPAA